MRLAAAGVAALVAAGCTPAPDRGDREREIIGGVADDAHPSVVVVLSRELDCTAPDRVHCSGVLVGPRAVLTAAHCLEGAEGHELEVLVGPAVDAPEEILAVWRSYVHPEYAPFGDPERSFDLAVLALERAPAPQPATLPRGPLDDLTAGTTLLAVGFGRQDPDVPPGRRVAASADVDTVTPEAIFTGDQGVPCGGDSGGAQFFDTPDGEVLAGIVKASGEACTGPGLSMRVDTALESFLAPTLDEIANAPASPRPALAAIDDFCTHACERAEDCPVGMLCLPERDGSRCGYRDVRTHGYGERCEGTPDDGCVRVGQGSERDCRTLLTCEPRTGGCAANAAGGSPWPLLVCLVALARRRVTEPGGRS